MARDFDGASDINYTLNSGQTSSNTITVAWWEYPDSVAQYARVWHKGNGSNDARMEFDDSWGYVFAAGWSTPGGGAGKWSITKPSTGAWVHHAVTYDWGATTNDPIIYRNGTSQTITERVAPSGSAVNNQTPFYLGSEKSTGQYYNGRVAEFAWWHRILTASEIEGLADGFSPLFYPIDLVLYIPLIGRRTDESDLMFGITGSVDAGVTAIAHPRIIYPSFSQMRRFTTAVAAAAAQGAWKSLLGVGLQLT